MSCTSSHMTPEFTVRTGTSAAMASARRESEPLEQAREQEEVRGREQAIDVVAWPEHPDVVAQPHLLDA